MHPNYKKISVCAHKINFTTVCILNLWFVAISSLGTSPAKNIVADEHEHKQLMWRNFEGKIVIT